MHKMHQNSQNAQNVCILAKMHVFCKMCTFCKMHAFWKTFIPEDNWSFERKTLTWSWAYSRKVRFPKCTKNFNEKSHLASRSSLRAQNGVFSSLGVLSSGALVSSDRGLLVPTRSVMFLSQIFGGLLHSVLPHHCFIV